MPRVEVEGFPSIEAASEQTLLEACEAGGVPMESECGGFAACNSCRVEIIDGVHALSPLDDEELAFLDAPHQRLGCQARVLGPVRLRLAPGI